MPIRNVQSTLRQWVIENDRRARAELTEVAYDIGIKLVQQFREVVRNWEGKPTFSYRVAVDPRFIRVTVFPKGQYAARFRYVDLGTKPHTITARNVPFLHFQGGYDQKTLSV